MRNRVPLHQLKVLTHLFPDAGAIPNHRVLPLLVYQQVLMLPDSKSAAPAVETLLTANGWTGCWRNGIFTFHHYHSTAHEVLAVFQGSATVQLGGETGIRLDLKIGDALVIPAGVGHKNLGASSDFRVIGAYPDGQDYDLCYGKPGERPRTDQNIARVPSPQTDPFYGKEGPLISLWPS